MGYFTVDKGIYQRSVRFVKKVFLGAYNFINLVNHILKSLQKQAGLNQIGELSGHSFRVGAAIDLLNKNIPL